MYYIQYTIYIQLYSMYIYSLFNVSILRLMVMDLLSYPQSRDAIASKKGWAGRGLKSAAKV